MKKVFSLALLTFASMAMCRAQDNQLKFSQVKLVSSMETVPDDKVWKVVSVLPSCNPIQTSSTTYTNAAGTGTYAFLVNGSTIYVSRVEAVQGSFADSNARSRTYTNCSGELLPIWLPAGSTLAASTCIHSISVVEFNVVPE